MKGLAAAAKLETRSTISVDLMNERLMRGRRSHMTQSIARSLSEFGGQGGESPGDRMDECADPFALWVLKIPAR